ncbi:DUF4097 family beta strand repeat-containing protein [Nocardiopsis sp. RSe5-2]|uniref:DUF4097 family beta strand repeat-containing protein n=1 Tax=Nocardiopsis endophytica TaxID=3018445 RepID=A0ABT4U9L6_9ACTN|nr:DUF4097 family beta strand repeat-containing protein [Nocardiopsis endophytica]MDA2813659.1 DUF4097 family beta strand repeat-containing protein [Nocardiopsis endophytica]
MTFNARGLYASSSKVPRQRRFRWMWLGIVAAVAALVTGVAAALGAVPVGGEERPPQRFDGAERVVIENRTPGEVTVTGADTDAVEVRAELKRSLLFEPDVRLDERGGEVRAEASCQATLMSACSVDYDVTVPEGADVEVVTVGGEVELVGVQGTVRAESVSGPIEAEDLGGDARLETTSAPIDVKGATGTVEARSVSGPIEMEGVDSDRVIAESTSGPIEIEGAFTTAELETTSGPVEVETRERFESLRAESTSGNVELRVPDGAYDVRTETSSGNADVDVRDDSGADSSIRASTTSGNVEVRTGGDEDGDGGD